MPAHTPHTFIIAIVLTFAHEDTCTITELGLLYCRGLNKGIRFITFLSEVQINQY